MEKMTMELYVKEALIKGNQNIKDYAAVVGPLLNYIGTKKIKKLWLIASGSSYNACHCARSFMLTYLPCDITILTPFTFTYYEHAIDQDDLVIVITQSGLSTNALEALKKVKRMGHDSICLTGNVQSDAKDIADIILDYGVGIELVGYVTKGVTTLCLYLELFTIAYTKRFDLLEELNNAMKLNADMIVETEKFITQHYKNFSSMSQVYVCGAGTTMGVAMEGALKIGETIHIPSFAYETEEFIHGPNLQLTPAYTLILFDDNCEASDRIVQIYKAARKVSDRVYIISSNTSLLEDNHALSIQHNTINQSWSLAYLPFVQLLSYRISNDMNTTKQHPLLKEFKKVVNAKTDNFVNYDEDE